MINGIRQTAVVKPGGMIELQAAELPVGKTVEVIVLLDNSVPNTVATAGSHPLVGLSREQRISKIRSALGGWKNDTEITDIFTEVDRERHAYKGRPLVTFDE